jgi:hypothetical protein
VPLVRRGAQRGCDVSTADDFQVFGVQWGLGNDDGPEREGQARGEVMELNGTRNGGGILQVKNWHVVLTLVSWLVISVAQFVSVRAQAEETARRVTELEKSKVEQKQFDELRDDIIRRLDRIESKVDAERRH